MKYSKHLFVGGPFDGTVREINGQLFIYAAEQPGIDCVQFPPKDPTCPLVRKTHRYTLCEDGTYTYDGVR